VVFVLAFAFVFAGEVFVLLVGVVVVQADAATSSAASSIIRFMRQTPLRGDGMAIVLLC
jgi:hypothetical protein